MAYCIPRGRNVLAAVFQKGSPGYHRCFSRLRLDATVSVVGRRHQGHHKDLTETGNRAGKVSGSQGTQGLQLNVLEIVVCLILFLWKLSFLETSKLSAENNDLSWAKGLNCNSILI